MPLEVEACIPVPRHGVSAGAKEGDLHALVVGDDEVMVRLRITSVHIRCALRPPMRRLCDVKSSKEPSAVYAVAMSTSKAD